MDAAKRVAMSIQNSFWTFENEPNALYGIRLYNRAPYTNANFPYQLAINIYSRSSPSFLADTTQIQGGVRLGGGISYGSDAWFGTLSDDGRKILWRGTIGGKPLVWERAGAIAPNTQNDQYDGKSVLATAAQGSQYLYDRMHTAYSTYE